MLNINELKFDAQGLIPAVVVDAASKKVLTLAYMNRESLEISMKEGRTCFWSRSRQELWHGVFPMRSLWKAHATGSAMQSSVSATVSLVTQVAQVLMLLRPRHISIPMVV